MNLTKRDIICSVPPAGPKASLHLMVVLLNWVASTIAVVLTLRVKTLARSTRGLTSVATAVASVVWSMIGANEVGPLLVNTNKPVNKLLIHSRMSP